MINGSRAIMHAFIVGDISSLNPLVIIETFIFTSKVSQDFITAESTLCLTLFKHPVIHSKWELCFLP